jgi:uncharacterized protein (DUF1015 family)
VLQRDAEERFYVLAERVSDGRVRRGILAQLRLAAFDERVVLRHEQTMARPIRDRLLLTRAVKANLEPLFFLYEDPEAKLGSLLETNTAAAVLADCLGPDGTELRLAAVSDEVQIAAIREFLADGPVVIADGHHRYQAMLDYRDERRQAIRDAGREPGPDEPHEFVLAYLVNAFDPGSQLAAIHRVIEGEIPDLRGILVGSGFRLEEIPASKSSAALLEALRARREHEHAFVFVGPAGLRLLASRPRGQDLDVEVLHAELLPSIGGELSFDSKPDRLLERVASGEAALGILLDALDPASLFRVVKAGRVLPQKSTFFTPKIPSGLVIRDFE